MTDSHKVLAVIYKNAYPRNRPKSRLRAWKRFPEKL